MEFSRKGQGMKTSHEMDEVRAEITRVLEEVPGITTNVGQPIEHRLSHILSGTPAAIAISVYGDDLDVLRNIAAEIEGALSGLAGARDVAANREVTIQSLPKLASFGRSSRDFGASYQYALPHGS